jgi:hypothetical protein
VAAGKAKDKTEGNLQTVAKRERGRISTLKLRHGLRRSLYRGFDGMQRWVGLGVIADNFIQMGCYLALQDS